MQEQAFSTGKSSGFWAMFQWAQKGQFLLTVTLVQIRWFQLSYFGVNISQIWPCLQICNSQTGNFLFQKQHWETNYTMISYLFPVTQAQVKNLINLAFHFFLFSQKQQQERMFCFGFFFFPLFHSLKKKRKERKKIEILYGAVCKYI